MSTNALNSGVTAPDFYSSLEYLVAPIPAKCPDGPQEDAPGEQSSPENELNNSLQKLTNLVYMLGSHCQQDENARTTVTLMQAELARLAVLVRKQSGTQSGPRKK